jgi:lauroyl/myristoyl acyltransferase
MIDLDRLASRPLAESLEILAGAVRTAEPAAPFITWARRALRLPPEAERAWFTRALWGFYACRLVMNVLYQGRIDEVLERVLPPDMGPLDRALEKGRGALLATAHVGPNSVTRALFRRLNYNLLVLASYNRSPDPKVRAFRVSQDLERRKSLIECLLHLRRHGVVLIAADGEWGQSVKTYPLLNHSVTVRRGTAHLAALSKAPTIWYFTYWDPLNRKIRATLEDSGLDPGQVQGDWEDTWISAFLKKLADFMTRRPESLGFNWGFWDAGQGGFSTMGRQAPGPDPSLREAHHDE